MPTFKLDGEEIPFEPGDTIIRAAWRKGVEIPHYCWHPGLSIAANCRMCLVEVKDPRTPQMPILKWDARKSEYVPATKPKLVPACQTPAVAGQEVCAQNAEALAAQASVQEFLLLNHPVDCPICDQAGECKLQDYWLTSQGKLKRKLTEPVHKPKGVRFGSTIVYDAERCIMCTRCIRVCDEVAHDHVLDMRERGNRNEIVLSPGRELDHKYTFMTEHVCPVGALTTSDFRFKARVWFLRSQKSVCDGCATGCNTFADYDPRTQRVYRLRPRDNEQVNKFWMCDDGMMSYTRAHEDRVESGIVRDGRGIVRTERAVPVSDAIEAAAKVLRGVDTDRIAVVLGAGHSTEDNMALVKFAAALGTTRLYLAARGGWEGDKILRDADDNANRRGAQLAAGGKALPELSQLLPAIAAGEVAAVVALGAASREDAAALAPITGLAASVSLTTHVAPLSQVAAVVVPVACHFEMEGTFVNARGMAQRFWPAIPAPEGVRPAWETIAVLAKALGKDLGLASLADIRKTMPAASTAPATATGARP
jgi:NADH-quinone oxidoreductase subunit G